MKEHVPRHAFVTQLKYFRQEMMIRTGFLCVAWFVLDLMGMEGTYNDALFWPGSIFGIEKCHNLCMVRMLARRKTPFAYFLSICSFVDN